MYHSICIRNLINSTTAINTTIITAATATANCYYNSYYLNQIVVVSDKPQFFLAFKRDNVLFLSVPSNLSQICGEFQALPLVIPNSKCKLFQV